MTICLYADRTLYADRAGISLNHPMFFTEMKKIYLDGSKCFAIANTGEPFTQDRTFFLGVARLYICLQMADSSDSDIAVNEKHLGAFIGERQCIVVTRNKVYGNRYKGNLAAIDMSSPYAVGSGNAYATIALQAGKSPLEAMKISSLTDSVSHLTEIDSVKMSDLKPFPKPTVKAKPVKLP